MDFNFVPVSWPRHDDDLGGGNREGRMCRMNLSHHPRDMERKGDENYWGFPLHCACWGLLTALGSWGVLDTQAIFDVCRSFPTKGMMVLFGNDYGGICETDRWRAEYPWDKSYWMRYKKRKPLGQEPVMENPLTVPNIQQMLEEGYINHIDHSVTNFIVAGGSTQNDPFSALPFEILDLILVKLTLVDISQLRQASRECAGHVMSDAFWHSRFRRGGEFEHLFEFIKNESLCKGRWKSIFFKVKEL